MLILGLALHPFGGIWGVFTIYAVAMAAYLPGRQAAATMLVIGLAVAGLGLWRDLPLWHWVPTLFIGALVGMSTRYSATIEATNRELAASREESRRLLIAAERERIARDLHDVLGHTLTVVAVKADLAGKLLNTDPDAARREIEDIRRTARAALADVRSAVTGMRAMTLAAELAAARYALECAGIGLEQHIAVRALPPPVETALAFVLREAVTNIIRHSRADRCTIALTTAGNSVQLEIRDNGHRNSLKEGNGIAGMRQRIASLSGTLIVETSGGTVVRALIPVAESTDDQSSGG